MRKVIILGSKLVIIALSISACKGSKTKEDSIDSSRPAIIQRDSVGNIEVIIPGTINIEVVLNAGEQALLDEPGIEIRKVDLKNWEFGDLKCDQTSLVKVMKYISRWYYIKIDSKYPDVNLTGTLTIENDLHKVIPKLEEMSGLKFKIVDSTIKTIG